MYHNRGDIRDETDKRGALEDYRKVAALEEELVAADPANARTRKDLAFTDKKLGEMLVGLGDNVEALRYFRRAVEGFESGLTTTPGNLVARLDRKSTRLNS